MNPNTTYYKPSASETPFKNADDDLTLNAGLAALNFFRGPGPVLLKNLYFCNFSGVGPEPLSSPTLWISPWRFVVCTAKIKISLHVRTYAG